LLVCLALMAFAANSIVCRLALNSGHIDAGAFTAVRIVSGALALMLIVRGRTLALPVAGALPALALFAYATCFSFAYIELTAGTGALLLFGAVQVTMILGGLVRGERPGATTWLGWLAACSGLVYLVVPGVESPPLVAASLMLCAGVAWGIYSLLGKGEADPAAATARNFVLATPMAIGLLMSTQKMAPAASWVGIAYAVASGALTSGIGYVIWYSALRHLTAFSAAVAQLSVPVIAATAGVLLLAEPISLRLAVGAAVILGGIAVAVLRRSS
jgi:drug/metabolite transporter (DMT)-like permease